MDLSKREHLIEAAVRLFKAEGYRAVGIERILSEAGVAKMTLYNHFKSKDELVLEAVRRMHQHALAALVAEVERSSSEPAERLRALVRLVLQECRERDRLVCVFLRAGAEFTSPESPARRAAAEHYERITDYAEALAREAGVVQPRVLAERLVLLIAGASAISPLNGSDAATDVASAAATEFLNAALHGRPHLTTHTTHAPHAAHAPHLNGHAIENGAAALTAFR